MTKIKLEQVFGVSREQVLSYLERSEVDGLFQDALGCDKQIIVYGSSKQGKTALVDKYVPYKENIVIRLTPKSSTKDIYKSLLNDLGIQVTEENSNTITTESSFMATGEAQMNIPFLATGKAGVNAELKSGSEKNTKNIPIKVNLDLPNDVGKLILSTQSKKFIILENFHYLNDDVQKELAFDLRTFQELGVRFIILGVWREKNRLAQFNGDLLDRIMEIPVEPWKVSEFVQVIEKGSEILNISFDKGMVSSVIDNAFDSIGVVQELIKAICKMAYVSEQQEKLKIINKEDLLYKAKNLKAIEYASRHTKALESIAEGRKTTNITDGNIPLFLPYYTVKAFLKFQFDDIVGGIRRDQLEKSIKDMHHRASDIRSGDMSNLLNNFASLQSEKNIIPPIFDYDKTTKTVRVVDSTFYFYLRNINRQEVIAQINNPLEK